CTHAILDHRFRLILFRDLAEVAADPRLQWAELVDFAGRWHLRSLTYLAWLMAAHLARGPVPATVLAELRPSNWPTRLLEAMLPRTDVVHFDGHRPHPVNLATVLVHDDFLQRVVLATRAPLAVPSWARRVGSASSAGDRRVTIVVTSNRRRGAEVVGERLRDGLTTFGWEAFLVALAADKSGGFTVDAGLISDRSVDQLGRLDLDIVRGFRGYIHATRPRLIIANGSATLQYSVAATFALRNRPAMVYISIGEPRYWVRGLRRRLVHRLLLSRVDLILAVSRETARQLVDDLGVPAQRVRVAYTGVPEQLLEIEGEQSQLTAKAELRLLFVGNLSEEKRPLLALEVLDRLTVPARLRLVGSGPMMNFVLQKIEDLDLADRVEVTGAVPDVRPHLAWADLLVLTSKTEGLPGAVLEAAAAGVPSVAFAVGGTGETILDGVTGRLIVPGDLAGMVGAIEKMADPEQRAAFGRAAREMVRRAFTLEDSIRHHHELLLEVAGDLPVTSEADGFWK
ncbi:MAG: glycosyltransferase, partial [Actinobacteria bacterium]|nr:glycosyltransferase [Actinomycetota bacterium]